MTSKISKKNKYVLLDDKARNSFYLMKNSTVKKIKARETKNAMSTTRKKLLKAIKKRNSYKIYNY